MVAIELLAAAQGLDFRRPLRSSAALERAAQEIRALVGPYERDRYFAPDIEAITRHVRNGACRALVGEIF